MPAIGRLATPVTVFVDGEPSPLFRALHAKRTTGGKELDRADLEYDLAAAGERLINWEFFREPTEIEIVASISGVGDVVLHWGKLAIDGVRIAERTERLELVSRAEPFHFGEPITGQWRYNPLTDAAQLCPVDLIFNPQIDGKCWPNMAPTFISLNNLRSPIFLDPESVRTETAKKLFGVDPLAVQVILPNGQSVESGGADFWTLAEAVLHLCVALNGTETNVYNPTLDQLSLLDPSPDLLRDFRLSRGLFLPEALEELLTPFGYGFYVDYEQVGTRRLKFFQRGESLFQDAAVLAAPGNPIGDSNAPEIDLDYNRGNARNQLIVHGDFLHIESTFTLQRAWAADLDDLDPTTDLAKDSDNFQNTPSYRDAWRKWALNESGDYTGLRVEIDKAYDFAGDAPNDGADGAPAFKTQVPKRRKFLPCITQGDDLAPIGDAQGCVIEWSADAGASWQPLEQLDNHTCHLLKRECGVLFDSQLVPAQLYQAGVDARVRITATVRMDDRLIGRAESETGPQGDAAPAFVDAADRYHFRMLSPNSKFFEQVAAESYPSDAIDDSIAIGDCAKQLLDAWNMADLSGSITIEGLDRVQYNLADIVYKIEGREISFAASGPGAAQSRNPQIVGLEYSLRSGAQFRRLKLETYREEAPP